MSTFNPKISVIIPIYQHWELTEGLFKALDQQSLPKQLWDCYIVDNGSDNVPSQNHLPIFVTLLECPTPGSYAARNMALSHAKGELLVFTDADCRPDNDWLEKIWISYQTQESPTLIAGGVTVKKFQPIKPNPIEIYDIATGLPQDRYTKHGFAVTANLSIPRAVLDDIGQFDDRRYSGGDIEFCQRARAAGFLLVYAPEANVNHPARDSWKELTTKIKRIKGGQIMGATKKQKIILILKSFTPPVGSAWYAIKTPRVTPTQKLTTLWVMATLWLIGIGITARILLSGNLERR